MTGPAEARNGALRVALVALGVYVLGHALARWLLSPALTTDDYIETVFSQTLAFGYTSRQPPLFVWLLHGLESMLGVGLGPFLILRYGALAAFFVLAFLLARRVFGRSDLAAFAAASYALIYQIGWMQHQMFTHTALMMVAIVASLHVAIALWDRPTIGRALLFGIVLAVGALSKHGFFAHLAVIAAGVAATPSLRRSAPLGHLALAAGLAAGLYAPYAAFLLATPDTIARHAQDALLGKGGYLDGLAEGAGNIVIAWFGFLSPLLPVLLVLFPRFVVAAPAAGLPGRDWLVAYERALVAVLVLMLVALIAFGVETFRERHMLALLLVAPLVMFGRIAALPPAPGRFRALAMIVAGVAAVGLAFRFLQALSPGEPFCDARCREAKAMPMLAEAIRRAGFSGGTLIGTDTQIAGNLRVSFPEARILTPELPFARARTGNPGPACLFVSNAPVTAAERFAWAQGAFPMMAPLPGAAAVLAPAGFRTGGRAPRERIWRIEPLDPASPACRAP
jgi:hypothetical protein